MKKQVSGKKIFYSFFIICVMMFCGTVTASCSSSDDSGTKNEANPLWEAGNVKNKIVTISDLHIGIEHPI